LSSVKLGMSFEGQKYNLRVFEKKILKTVFGPSQRKQHVTPGNNVIWGTKIISFTKYFVG